MMGLTPCQLHCLTVVRAHLQQTGGVHLPSYRVLMRDLGIRSLPGVHRLIHALIDRGHLIRLQHPLKGFVLGSTCGPRLERIQYFRFDDDTKQLVGWPDVGTAGAARNQPARGSA